jgi:hypothetical protein
LRLIDTFEDVSLHTTSFDVVPLGKLT